MSEKEWKIISRIEKEMRKLAEETGVDHISCFLINGNFNIEDYTDIDNQKFSYFNGGLDNE